MEHEDFPVQGFEFMNEPATNEQKVLFIALAKRLGHEMSINGPWPQPFTRWDAARSISVLQSILDTEDLLADIGELITPLKTQG